MTEFPFPSFFALRKNNRRFWRDPGFGSASVEFPLFHGFPIVSYRIVRGMYGWMARLVWTVGWA